MEGVREYLLSVTCAAVLCGILCTIVDEKQTGGALVKLLCGVFLSLSLILPLSRISLTEADPGKWNYVLEGEAAAEEGLEYARQAKMQIIKSRTEAYILDKAREYDLDLRVEAEVSGDEVPVPMAVMLWGRASPYAKLQLQHFMETEMGIPREKQRWMESDSG